METMNVVIEVILCALMFFLLEDLIKRNRSKKIFYIEDSETEQILFKSKVRLDKAMISCFYDLHSALNKMGWTRPDAVIVDYHLPDGKGEEIYKACERLRIPVIVVTGEEGILKGIDESKVIHKSPDLSHLDRLQIWLNQQAIA